MCHEPLMSRQSRRGVRQALAIGGVVAAVHFCAEIVSWYSVDSAPAARSTAHAFAMAVWKTITTPSLGIYALVTHDTGYVGVFWPLLALNSVLWGGVGAVCVHLLWRRRSVNS